MLRGVKKKRNPKKRDIEEIGKKEFSETVKEIREYYNSEDIIIIINGKS